MSVRYEDYDALTDAGPSILTTDELIDLVIEDMRSVVSCDFDTLDLIACRLVRRGWVHRGWLRG